MLRMTDFDELATTWDDDPEKARRAREVVDAIRAAVPLAATMRALEYGSGTGLLGRALVDDLAHITLADSSAGMTSAAAAAVKGDDRLTAVRLDLMADPVPADRYDLVTSLLALHHVEDTGRLLAALHTLLNPGGWLALADLDADGGAFHHGHADFHGHNGFERGHLAGLLTDAGFRDVTITTVAVLTKEVAGQPRDFPLFLATARR